MNWAENCDKMFWIKSKNILDHGGYLIDHGGEGKKAKGKEKKLKRNLQVENYKSCLEGTQLQSETDHLENSKIDAGNIKKIINNL